MHAGKLFAAMHSVDADGLIKFVFPAERLPSHTQAWLPVAIGYVNAFRVSGKQLATPRALTTEQRALSRF